MTGGQLSVIFQRIGKKVKIINALLINITILSSYILSVTFLVHLVRRVYFYLCPDARKCSAGYWSGVLKNKVYKL